MHSASFDSWITQGVAQRQWFPEETHCVTLVTPESCSQVLSWLKKAWQRQGYSSTFVSASEIDSVEFEMLLEMSSLQPVSIMVITMDIEPSRKLYTRLVEYCSRYQGSYRIVMVTSVQPKLSVQNNNIVKEIPKHIDSATFLALHLLSSGNDEEKSTVKIFFDYVSRITSKLTLTQACAVIPYIHVLGRGKEEFCRAWLPSLVQPQSSLFTLSQHLFARDARAFYATWNTLSSRYPDEFWLVYWSDQLWQAYCFVFANRSGKSEQATLFTKGLPFSFIQRGWRSYQPELLAEAVELMYDYDCHAKQGGLMIPYELLFNKILTASSQRS